METPFIIQWWGPRCHKWISIRSLSFGKLVHSLNSGKLKENESVKFRVLSGKRLIAYRQKNAAVKRRWCSRNPEMVSINNAAARVRDPMRARRWFINNPERARALWRKANRNRRMKVKAVKFFQMAETVNKLGKLK